MIGADGELNILGNINNHRAGAAIGGNMKRLVQHFSEVVYVTD